MSLQWFIDKIPWRLRGKVSVREHGNSGYYYQGQRIAGLFEHDQIEGKVAEIVERERVARLEAKRSNLTNQVNQVRSNLNEERENIKSLGERLKRESATLNSQLSTLDQKPLFQEIHRKAASVISEEITKVRRNFDTISYNLETSSGELVEIAAAIKRAQDITRLSSLETNLNGIKIYKERQELVKKINDLTTFQSRLNALFTALASIQQTFDQIKGIENSLTATFLDKIRVKISKLDFSNPATFSEVVADLKVVFQEFEEVLLREKVNKSIIKSEGELTTILAVITKAKYELKMRDIPTYEGAFADLLDQIAANLDELIIVHSEEIKLKVTNIKNRIAKFNSAVTYDEIEQLQEIARQSQALVGENKVYNFRKKEFDELHQIVLDLAKFTNEDIESFSFMVNDEYYEATMEKMRRLEEKLERKEKTMVFQNNLDIMRTLLEEQGYERIEGVFKAVVTADQNESSVTMVYYNRQNPAVVHVGTVLANGETYVEVRPVLLTIGGRYHYPANNEALKAQVKTSCQATKLINEASEIELDSADIEYFVLPEKVSLEYGRQTGLIQVSEQGAVTVKGGLTTSIERPANASDTASSNVRERRIPK